MSDNWLEVRIPISPLDHYFNRIRYIANSIRSLGTRYRKTRIRVTVGDASSDPQDLYARLPWSRSLGIDWHWIGREEFEAWKATAHPYVPTMMERFRPPFSTQHILMLDADVVALRPFDELFEFIEHHPGIVGVMAHASPFGSRDPAAHESRWKELYHLSGLGEPRFEYQHSGWGSMDLAPSRRMSPPYFNTGVLLASSSSLEKLYRPYMDALALVRQTMNTYFFEQIALTLALMQAKVPYHVAPLRYNFPNDPLFDKANPDDLREIRLLHFLRTDTVRREADFEDINSVARLVERADLSGSNELLRRRIAELSTVAQ